jgi:hypothetical protein
MTKQQVVRDVSKGSPQRSCCRPELWIIQYNSLHNFEFRKQTKEPSQTNSYESRVYTRQKIVLT